MSGYHEALLVILAINVIAAYAAYLPLTAGQLNLGTAGFMAIGAYLAAYLSNEFAVPTWICVVAGASAAGLVGLLIAYPVLRARGIYLVLATMAFGELIRTSLLDLEIVGAAAGYPVHEFIPMLPICVTAVLVTVGVGLLYQTRFGLCLLAVREDDLASRQFGINVRAFQAAAFAMGSFLAGLAGALYAHHYSYVEAQYFNVVLSVYIAMYVLFGGIQTVLGPLLGAVFFTFMPEIFRAGDSWRFVIFAAALILILAWRPQGLVDNQLMTRIAGGLRLSRSGKQEKALEANSK